MQSALLEEDGSLAHTMPINEPNAPMACVQPQPLENPPQVNTFDVFDTLIARRCIEPVRIFEIIASRSGIENFTAARVQAEALAAQESYDLDKIYSVLSTILNLNREETAKLKALEISVEIENVIPVAENMALVGDGDILISDMYLSAEVIRRMLDEAGLRKRVALIVTSNGKHSGRIWPQILEEFAIKHHLGDNLHSDNAMPKQFGINCRHTNVSAPNFVEKALLEAGLRDLAMVSREARLAIGTTNNVVQTLQIIQASLNFPILVLASLALVRLVQKMGFSSLLFSSRDCNLWLPLFRIVARDLGLDCKSDYFYTSRITRTNPSASYLDYARREIQPGALVIDICGTGWSLSHLFEKLGLSGQHAAFLHKLPKVQHYERCAPAPPSCTIHALLGSSEHCNNEALEMSNYAGHGMVTDVKSIGRHTMLPVFGLDQRPAHIRAAIEAQQASFLRALEIMRKHVLRETYALDDLSLQTSCHTLYQSLSQQNALRAVFSEQHNIEEMTTLRQLGCLQGAALSAKADS